MSYKFLELVATPSVRAVQAEHGSLAMWDGLEVDRDSDRFTDGEAAFIAARDSFYLASVSETGWPYVQHRGGPPGFLQLIDDRTLGFADFRGNRQYISTGNARANDRVALMLMDYPNRTRLKILAHLSVRAVSEDEELASRLVVPGYKGKPQSLFVLRLEAFDWNCPQHITPRFTTDEVDRVLAPLRDRNAALELEIAQLRRP